MNAFLRSFDIFDFDSVKKYLKNNKNDMRNDKKCEKSKALIA